MKAKRFFTRSRVEALVVLGGVAGYIWQNYQLPGFYRVPGIPGPTVFPLALGIAMGLAALWLFFSRDEEPAAETPAPPAHGVEAAVEAAAEAEAFPETLAPDSRSVFRRLVDRWHFYAMWALLLGYVVFMPHLGFVLASSLLLVSLFRLLGERNWLLAVLLAVGFSLAIYFGFAKGLQIRLPAGVLAGWL